MSDGYHKEKLSREEWMATATLMAACAEIESRCSICGEPSTVTTIAHGELCDECAGEAA